MPSPSCDDTPFSLMDTFCVHVSGRRLPGHCTRAAIMCREEEEEEEEGFLWQASQRLLSQGLLLPMAAAEKRAGL